MPQMTKQPAKWNTDPLTTSGRAIASEDKEGEPRKGGKEEDLAGVQDTRYKYTKQGREGQEGRGGPKLGERKEEERERRKR